MSAIAPLRDFVSRFTRLISDGPRQDGPGQDALLREGKHLLSELIATDGWLPDAFAQSDPQFYRQYLLHCDPLERFSVVSFVWGPGQRTPLHDHRVWAILGLLRGREREIRFHRDSDGRLVPGETRFLERGEVETLSPGAEDYHLVSNGLERDSSVAIHVYGGNIGAVPRAIYDPETGTEKPFISGYSNAVVPNLWDRSARPAA
jgi:3-mercaptopropionate dioxygenase